MAASDQSLPIDVSPAMIWDGGLGFESKGFSDTQATQNMFQQATVGIALQGCNSMLAMRGPLL